MEKQIANQKTQNQDQRQKVKETVAKSKTKANERLMMMRARKKKAMMILTLMLHKMVGITITMIPLWLVTVKTSAIQLTTVMKQKRMIKTMTKKRWHHRPLNIWSSGKDYHMHSVLTKL